MAHRFRGRGRGISQSQRRKKLWSTFSAEPATNQGVPGTSGLLATTIQLGVAAVTAAGPGIAAQASVGVVFSLGQAPATIGPESTLLRLRGSLTLDKNAVDPGNTIDDVIQTNAFGIGVMESGAALLGAFPNPATPEGADWDGWMFYRSINTSILDAEGSVIDVKSMRKIQSGYSLIFVFGTQAVPFDTDDTATAPAVLSILTARGLFLLP